MDDAIDKANDQSINVTSIHEDHDSICKKTDKKIDTSCQVNRNVLSDMETSTKRVLTEMRDVGNVEPKKSV